MSNSKRKTPIISNSHSGARNSEKEDKQIINREIRRHNKMELNVAKDTDDLDDLMLIDKAIEVSDIWAMKKDGKGYFGDVKGSAYICYDDKTYGDIYNKLMRK